MLFFTADILLCAVRDAQCKTRESPQRDIVGFGIALTWILLSQFEKHLPQSEIKCTRRIRLEIRFNLTKITREMNQ